MSWTLIENPGDLERVMDSIHGADAVAVDTEFMRRNTYFPQVALLQVCADEHAWLIDPLKIEDRAALTDILQIPTAVQVLHSCSEDLEVFRHWLGAVPEPLIDTQRAAALLGEAFGLGYRALVEQLLGVALEKGETRSDWLKRPLSDSQCHYAAQDVIQLLPAWRVLEERAENQGRMDWVREESREVLMAQADREAVLYRRIKGSGRLGRRQLGALKNLCAWREQRAIGADKPRGWVLDDKLCLAIAQRMPETRDALGAIEGIPPAVLRRQADALIGCVTAALESPEGQLPAAPPPTLPAPLRDALKSLRVEARQLAEALGVAPEILAGSADLELLVREHDGQVIDIPRRWQGWRRERVIAPLRQFLGRSS